MSDTITVLSHSNLKLAKTWHPDGSITPYDSPKYFTHKKVPLANFNEMAEVLSRLTVRSNACVIRGTYLGDEHAKDIAGDDYKPDMVLRQLDYFEDHPHHWVLIEVDNYVPISVDPIDDPVGACDEFIYSLPTEFHEASYFWQLSNSAGHEKHIGKLKAHIWFWLDTSYTSSHLKGWAKHLELPIDTAVFNTVQVHYTSSPIFLQGVPDPVPFRSGTRRRDRDSVPLTIPDDIPILTRDTPSQREKLSEAYENDPIAVALFDRGMVKKTGKKGELFIDCPRSEHHTGPSVETATAYYPAHTGGYAQGHFKCLHAHCVDEPRESFLEAMGIATDDADLFDMLDTTSSPPVTSIEVGNSQTNTPVEVKRHKFDPIHVKDFAVLHASQWLIKGVLPVADVCVMYGAPGSGKSFVALDMAAAIAMGTAWRNIKTRKGRVAYVVAEGAGGFKKRLVAFSRHHNVPLDQIDIFVIPHAPNLLKADDVRELYNRLAPLKPIALVVIDTLAQSTAGGNENSSEDMGKALGHCRTLAQKLETTVLLIHHSGKDETRGARGWSGIKAAVDAELEIARDENVRALQVTKQKDGEDGGEYGFKLTTVELGLDDDGDMITSCVVEHNEGTMKAVRSRKTLGANEQLLLEAIGQVTDVVGNGGIPVETIITKASEIRGIPEGQKARSNLRNNLSRALLGLQRDGLVTVAAGLVEKTNI